jgi:hypothetical protein
MTRKSDYDLGTSQEHTFSVTVENAKTGEHSSVLIGAKGQHHATGVIVLFDADGQAYVRKPDGSRLIHVRAPQYDLDESEQVHAEVKHETVKYFPVNLFSANDLGGEPIGQVPVRFVSQQSGERRVLVDAEGNRYVARPDGKPGVVEDPASAKKTSTKASGKRASAKKAKTKAAKAKR